jgi:nucleotide-binding universal stress UspA family protein
VPEDGRTRRIRVTSGGPGTAALVLGHANDPASGRALEVAVDLAGRLHAHLHVVHAIDLADYPADPDAADWEEQGRRALAAEHGRVRAALAGRAVAWSHHAWHGDPVALLETVAEEEDALMIVVGTRGEGVGSAIDRLLRRSVSHGLVAHGGRPVLVVPGAAARTG